MKKPEKKAVNWEFRAIGELLDVESVKEVNDAEQFQCMVLWPGVWRHQAYLLMRASCTLLEDYVEASDRTHKREVEEYKRRMRGEQVPCSRIMKGQELKDFEDMQSLPIGLLLAGYAIENLLKGIIFSQKPELLSENLELNRRFTRHELDKLYRDAGFVNALEEIDSETRKLLDGLTQIVVWQGRYLFPLEFKEFIDKKPMPCDSPEEIERLKALYAKLDIKLSQIPAPPTHMEKRTFDQ
jgi:hypothetical protein